jgi:hypothetical protein
MLTESCEKIRLKSYPQEVVLYRELSTKLLAISRWPLASECNFTIALGFSHVHTSPQSHQP